MPPPTPPVVATPGKKPKKPFYKRIWFLILVGLMIIGYFAPDSEKTETSKEISSSTSSMSSLSSNEVPQGGGATSENESPQGRLADAILVETGKTNIKGYGDRVQLVEWSDEQTLIRLLGDENITEGTTKSSNRRLVLETISAYQQSGLSSEIIAIEIFYPLIDNLGNESLSKILGYGFTQEQITLIRSENIDTKRMDINFADLFTIIHPSFRW